MFQSLQTSNKKFKIAFTFLTAYNGIFDVTYSNNKFYFAKSITDKDGFIQKPTPQRAYELELLNDEIKRIIFDERHFSETDYPLTIKPNFSILGSLTKISRQKPLCGFLPDDSIRKLLSFN